jgi:hypothetical protein
MQFDRVQRSPGFVCGSRGPLLISVWDAAPTLEMASIAASVLQQVARTESGVVVLSVLGPNTPPPEGAVRQAFAESFDRHKSRIAAVAQVVEGEGFRAAAMRSVLVGITLLLRPGFEQKACATIADAAQFLSEHSKGKVGAADVIRGVTELRQSAASALER